MFAVSLNVQIVGQRQKINNKTTKLPNRRLNHLKNLMKICATQPKM